MVEFTDFSLHPPIEQNVLRRLRLALRKRVPSVGLGAHLHRRMGQSLEFREYQDYVYGDDIRKVDWAASRRKGRASDLVAKSFESEEQRTLIILLDCRPAMILPLGVPKLGVAVWIAQCLAQAALAEKDRVIVAPVFAGSKARAPIRIEGPRGLAELRSYVASLLQRQDDEAVWQEAPDAGLAAVQAMLKPAAAVVLVSDAVFDDPNDSVARIAKMAQKSFRTFHLIEIDSWPFERSLLAEKPFRLLPLAQMSFEEKLTDAPDTYLDEVAAALAARRDALRARMSGPGLVWPQRGLGYPGDPNLDAGGARHWFKDAFPKAEFLNSLLSRVG